MSPVTSTSSQLPPQVEWAATEMDHTASENVVAADGNNPPPTLESLPDELLSAILQTLLRSHSKRTLVILATASRRLLSAVLPELLREIRLKHFGGGPARYRARIAAFAEDALNSDKFCHVRELELNYEFSGAAYSILRASMPYLLKLELHLTVEKEAEAFCEAVATSQSLVELEIGVSDGAAEYFVSSAPPLPATIRRIIVRRVRRALLEYLETGSPGLAEWELRAPYRPSLLAGLPVMSSKLKRATRVNSRDLLDFLRTPGLEALRNVSVSIGFFSLAPEALEEIGEFLVSNLGDDGEAVLREVKLSVFRSSALGDERDRDEQMFWRTLADKAPGIELRF